MGGGNDEREQTLNQSLGPFSHVMRAGTNAGHLRGEECFLGWLRRSPLKR